MKKLVVVTVFLLLCLGSYAEAKERIHTVAKGECLSAIGKRQRVAWRKIAEANNIAGPKFVIYPNQRLVIPADGEYAIGKEETGPRRWKKVSANPYKGTPEWALSQTDWPQDIRDKIKILITEDTYSWKILSKGQVFDGVTFGRNEAWGKTVADWQEGKAYAAKNFGVGEYHFVRVIACGNWVWWKDEAPMAPKKPEAEKPAPSLVKPKAEEIAKLPPIFVKKEYQRKRNVALHEFDAGVGAWKGEAAQGAWWFAQYKRSLQKMGKNLAGGWIEPVVGVFAKGDLGETDKGFDWLNAGIGPQAGVAWSGITDKGYPQSVQAMLRAIYEYAHGQNRSSGYDKKEDHILIGYYVEYLRRFHPEWMWILYSEGWADVWSRFNSTWRDDRASDRSSYSIGTAIHKDFTEEWAGRLGARLGFAPQDDVWGLNLHAEARYNDWFMFGPSLTYILSSAIPGAAGNFAAGGFARVELRKQVTEAWTETRIEQVRPADDELLEY